MEEGSNFNQSISPLSPERQFFHDLKFLAHENGIFQRADRELKKGIDWTDGCRSSMDKIRARTAVESSVLELKYPQVTLLPQFPPLFRCLRAMELGGELRRDGNTLLVGSGTTLYEALAVAVAAPSKAEVEEVAAEWSINVNNFHARRNASLRQGDTQSPNLTDHSIVAIEPDARQVKDFEMVNETFGTNTSIINKTLEEALPDLIGKEFDNIIINRLDPRIFEANSQSLTDLFNLVKEGGNIVFTIGTGNNELERDQRLAFIDSIDNILNQYHFKVSSRFPRIIKKENKNLFGPDIIGALVATKTAE